MNTITGIPFCPMLKILRTENFNLGNADIIILVSEAQSIIKHYDQGESGESELLQDFAL